LGILDCSRRETTAALERLRERVTWVSDGAFLALARTNMTTEKPMQQTADDAAARDSAGPHGDDGQHHAQGMQGSYARFFGMILTSTVAMFVLMYSLVYRSEHVRFADTRLFMALYMGAMMTVVMLAFMLGMYRNRRANTLIFAGAAVAFAVFLYLARSQRTVGDVTYMKAMIPHHSIAILTSSRAQIRDPRVRKLADQIIAAQNREIAEMDSLIGELERR